MTKKDVVDLFKIIVAVYPNFEVNQDKIDIWHRLLKDQDSTIILNNAERFVLENRFPPNIADLREVRLESKTNNFLEKMKEWEREAVGSKP